MIRTITSSLLRKTASFNRPVLQQSACFGSADKSGSVMDAWEKSCYHEMNYTIPEDDTVFSAVEKFSGYDVGALIAVDGQG